MVCFPSVEALSSDSGSVATQRCPQGRGSAEARGASRASALIAGLTRGTRSAARGGAATRDSPRPDRGADFLDVRQIRSGAAPRQHVAMTVTHEKREAVLLWHESCHRLEGLAFGGALVEDCRRRVAALQHRVRGALRGEDSRFDGLTRRKHAARIERRPRRLAVAGLAPDRNAQAARIAARRGAARAARRRCTAARRPTGSAACVLARARYRATARGKARARGERESSKESLVNHGGCSLPTLRLLAALFNHPAAWSQLP